MPANRSNPRFQLYYWPIPFRGCFVSYLFAYRNEPLLVEDGLEENQNLVSVDPGEQPIPFMGPPVLREIESGRTLSQMPAIVLYVAHELDLLHENPFDVATGVKILMDCNDLLMEICRYNGSYMWTREDWTAFRSQRFPRWLQIFEESLTRELIGKDPVTFADLGVFALFGNMIRCLPQLENDVLENAPGIHALCRKIGSTPSLARYVAQEERDYGRLYCGGQIEDSIRRMLELDAQ